jgi:hypothetical protein
MKSDLLRDGAVMHFMKDWMRRDESMNNCPPCHKPRRSDAMRVRAHKLSLAAFLLVLTVPACDEELLTGPALVEQLNSLSGITVTELTAFNEGIRLFQIDMDQPVDHDNPNGQRFTQRMYLHHVNETEPMVFWPDGYQTSESFRPELAAMLNSNWLAVTHRYWEDARPDPMNLEYLTIAQAAADHHAIVEKFKQVYTGVWISAGTSKSGGTAVYHRRHYPDDVVATVAYVAPFMNGIDDERFPPFIAAIGTDADRQRIRGFQRMALERLESLLPSFEAWFPQHGLTLAWDATQSLEGHIVEYETEYWQNRPYGTQAIPGGDASAQDILALLDGVSPFEDSSMEEIIVETPYMYQAFTEMGFPAFDRSHLEDLLTAEPMDIVQAFREVHGLQLVYRPEVMRDICEWVASEGDNMIFIYGGDDPWTAAAIELDGSTNSIRIINPGSGHDADIRALSGTGRTQVFSALEQWLGVSIN